MTAAPFIPIKAATPLTQATLPPFSRTSITGMNTMNGMVSNSRSGMLYQQPVGSPMVVNRIVETPVRMGQTINTTYYGGAGSGGTAYMDGGMAQAMAETPTIVRAV